MAIVAIIPARFGSTRLPGKPLLDIAGKPMIAHVHDRARLARLPDRVLVATDDPRIAAAVRGFGGEVVMTSPTHTTGTDRVAEALRGIDADIIVNVQGDEPMLDPSGIDEAASVLLKEPALAMSTLAVPLLDPKEMLSPGVVKVVVDAAGDALYFSRSPIPYLRLVGGQDPKAAAEEACRRGLVLKHVGLYAYRRQSLLALSSLPPAPLEEAEGLEQLRALHHRIPIRVVASLSCGGPSVDTHADWERVRSLFAMNEAT
ncbi:MAG TPA: 3-deoxy-manno-octulosonate cytidylyltransferase [Vicinamibacteria bacterium]|nr:3-deoxy-manno-octulosonate cytidylyltransferase [Vicinamibacteria bacterium]